MAKNDLQGTLDLLILKSLAQTSSMHGYGIVLHIEKGSLYPALHRMEQNVWIRSTWAPTETNRRAKFYSLTPTGRKQLAIAEKSWEQTVKGVQAVMRFA